MRIAHIRPIFGINLDLIMALPDKAAQEIMLKKEITEAIMADDYKRAKVSR